MVICIGWFIIMCLIVVRLMFVNVVLWLSMLLIWLRLVVMVRCRYWIRCSCVRLFRLFWFCWFRCVSVLCLIVIWV